MIRASEETNLVVVRVAETDFISFWLIGIDLVFV